ncbi:MAG: membrane-associated phospholipid phosphatase [Candidatus Nanohaloarchaea archaeon]
MVYQTSMLMFTRYLKEKVISFDNKVIRLVANRRKPILVDLATGFSSLCSPINIALYLLITASISSALATQFIIEISAVWATVYGIKYLVSRDRPEGNIEAGLTASFPSAHAATAFTLAPLFSQILEPAALLLYTAALLVATSRIYLQSHYLSDVVAGSAIGIIISAVLL